MARARLTNLGNYDWNYYYEWLYQYVNGTKELLTTGNINVPAGGSQELFISSGIPPHEQQGTAYVELDVYEDSSKVKRVASGRGSIDIVTAPAAPAGAPALRVEITKIE